MFFNGLKSDFVLVRNWTFSLIVTSFQNYHLFTKLLAKHGKPTLGSFDTTDGYNTCFKLF